MGAAAGELGFEGTESPPFEPFELEFESDDDDPDADFAPESDDEPDDEEPEESPDFGAESAVVFSAARESLR